jgi:hypothetical protein
VAGAHPFGAVRAEHAPLISDVPGPLATFTEYTAQAQAESGDAPQTARRLRDHRGSTGSGLSQEDYGPKIRRPDYVPEPPEPWKVPCPVTLARSPVPPMTANER